MTNISIEDRLALKDVMTTYCLEADAMSDIDALLNIFTEDIVFDMTPMGPKMIGHEQIREFFTQVFQNMSHNIHVPYNLRVNS